MKSLIVALLIGILSTSLTAEEKALVTFEFLSPETALEAAQAALKACREDGFQVAVAVVDRMGVTQVVLRDRFAGPHTPETASRKAWTATTFRTDTLSLSDFTKTGMPQSGAREITNALMIGGGVPMEAEGVVVAGIGVSGGPGGHEDDACARQGLESILEKLEF